MQQFPRSARLLKPGQFRAAFKKGRREHGDLLIATVSPNEGDAPRVGMAISRKAVPKAVGRNRVKRQIREFFRQNRQRLGGCDIVLTARASAREAEPERLREDLAKIWERIQRRWPSC